MSAQEVSKNISIVKFQPYKSSRQDTVADSIQSKLISELQKQGFAAQSSSDENISAALNRAKTEKPYLTVSGYYEKNEHGTLNLYLQVYDSEKGTLIDSIIIADAYSGLEGVKLDKEEMSESDESRIDKFVKKAALKIKNNPKKKTQPEDLSDLKESPLAKAVSFPFPAEEIEKQSAEVFQFLQETNINRQVEVASLFKEDELKVGSTVAVMDESQWKKYGSRRANEPLSFLPSIMNNNTLGGAQATSIRGYTNVLSFTGVAKLIDGVPINNFLQGSGVSNVANFGLGNTNRIEMIRGPGSAIYGSDAFHGVYSIKAFESEKDSTEVYGEAATLGFYSGYARASRGAFDNKLRIHASSSAQGTSDQQDPYRANLYTLVPKVNFIPAPFNSYPKIYDVPGVHKDKYENNTSTLKLDFKPSENLTIKTGLYTTAWNGRDFPGTGPAVSLYKDTSYLDSKFYMGKVSLEYKFPKDIILDVTAFGWRQTTNFITTLLLGRELGEIRTLNEMSRYGGTATLKQSANSWNTQWIASAGYNEFSSEDSKANADTKSITGFRLDTAFYLQNGFKWQRAAFEGKKRDIKSAFFQGKTGFFKDRVFILYGGRYDMYSDFGNQLIPRAGLIFMLQENTALKFLYGQAFRAPNAQDLTSSTAVLGNPKIKPEIIDSYEIVLMHKEKFWKTNLVLFENVWRNGIVRVLKPSLPQPFVAEAENKGVNKSRGAEIEFYFNNNKWDFLLSGSHIISKDYTQPEFITVNQSNFNVAQNPAFFTSQNPNGKRYTLFPRYIFSTGIGYNFDWNKLTVFLIQRWFSNFRDVVYENNTGSHYQKNYNRFDLTVSV
ncbi:MAG TPA: TonB-dependent receptor, partial [Leptospiraceae bacterium]|nr:TonB-dependent receptor [Leptospiraceae bacterium]